MENFNYSLSLENIKGLPFHKYENNFTFIVNGKQYLTSRIVADLLSPYIRQLHYIDFSINEFYLTTKQIPNEETLNNDFFFDFLSLATFNDSQIDQIRKKYYSAYFFILGNIEEYSKLQPYYTQTPTIDNVVDRLNSINEITSLINLNVNPATLVYDEIIEFAASHFEELDKKEMKKLSIEIIEKVLNSEKLKLKDEDSLLKFILSLYEKDKSYSVLFDYIAFSNVREETFDNFLREIQLEFINDGIWRSICNRIIKPKNASNFNEHKNEKNNNDGNGQKFDHKNYLNGKSEQKENFGGMTKMCNSNSNQVQNMNNQDDNINNGYHSENLKSIFDDYPDCEPIQTGGFFSSEINSLQNGYTNQITSPESTQNGYTAGSVTQIQTCTAAQPHEIGVTGVSQSEEAAQTANKPINSTQQMEKQDDIKQTCNVVKTLIGKLIGPNESSTEQQTVPQSQTQQAIYDQFTSPTTINSISSSSTSAAPVTSPSSSSSSVTQFSYSKGHEFEGVMRYLTGLSNGKNLHINKEIEVTSNSVYWNNNPANLINYKSDNFYQSLDVGGATVCFDFKGRSLQLLSYSIQSLNRSENGIHLKNWVLEVSNDQKKWTEVDRHQNDSKLNGPSFKAVFVIEKKLPDFYRFIRLRQIGQSWYSCSNHNYIGITFIEFFGNLKEVK